MCVYVSVCIYMSPGNRVCKVNNCRQEMLFLSHRDWHREHIHCPWKQPLFKVLDCLYDECFASFVISQSPENTNCCFFSIPSYLLHFTANIYSFIMLILVISPLSFLVCEIKSFPKSYKSLSI